MKKRKLSTELTLYLAALIVLASGITSNNWLMLLLSIACSVGLFLMANKISRTHKGLCHWVRPDATQSWPWMNELDTKDRLNQ